MDNNTSLFKKHHFKKFEEFGPTPRGCDWGEHEADLFLRYENMLALLRSTEDNVSLLDVGCGYGGLLSYAKEKGMHIDYTGIDVCANMIEHANHSHPGSVFICDDVLSYDFKRDFDYVVCNGIFTQKLSLNIFNMERHVKKIIDRMWGLASKGVAYNMMTTQVNFMVDNLYYKSPLEMMAYVMSLTSKFRIDSSYRLYEYTVYMYKNR